MLITGGAGYIGSHVVLAFREAGYPVVILDDLSTGCRAAVPDGVPFVEGNVGDLDTVGDALAEHRIAAVVHLAASASVPESMRDPLRYYRNNAGASAALIRACVDRGVERFIFSSTAAVYGIPRVIPAAEDAPPVPINPYGSSKLVTEWTLRDTAAAHDFRYIALRYFNVAGADPEGRAGPVQPGRRALDYGCLQSGHRRARPRHRVRRGLRYEGRHLRARLHPRVRSRRRPRHRSSRPGGRGAAAACSTAATAAGSRSARCSKRWRPRRGWTSTSAKGRGAREIRRRWWPTCRGSARRGDGRRAMTTSPSSSALRSRGRGSGRARRGAADRIDEPSFQRFIWRARRDSNSRPPGS